MSDPEAQPPPLPPMSESDWLALSQSAEGSGTQFWTAPLRGGGKLAQPTVGGQPPLEPRLGHRWRRAKAEEDADASSQNGLYSEPLKIDTASADAEHVKAETGDEATSEDTADVNEKAGAKGRRMVRPDRLPSREKVGGLDAREAIRRKLEAARSWVGDDLENASDDVRSLEPIPDAASKESRRFKLENRPIFVPNKFIDVLDTAISSHQPSDTEEKVVRFGGLGIVFSIGLAASGLGLLFLWRSQQGTNTMEVARPLTQSQREAAEMRPANPLLSQLSLAEQLVDDFLRDPVRLAREGRTVGGLVDAGWLEKAKAASKKGAERAKEVPPRTFSQGDYLIVEFSMKSRDPLTVIGEDGHFKIDARAFLTPETQSWSDFTAQRSTQPRLFRAEISAPTAEKDGAAEVTVKPVNSDSESVSAVLAANSRVNGTLRSTDSFPQVLEVWLAYAPEPSGKLQLLRVDPLVKSW